MTEVRTGTIVLGPVPAVRRRFGGDVGKLTAFVRRDFLVALSYRTAFLADAMGLVSQAIVFSFVSRMVAADSVPVFGASRPSYMEFVVVGIALGAFLQLGLIRTAAALRGEQLMGTLEVLFATPTSRFVLPTGMLAYDLVYVPVRTALFLLLAVGAFGVELHLTSIGPALAVLVVFVPVVWGIGMAAAAGILTLRRGASVTGLVAVVANLASGAFFPLELLPGWLEAVARFNPIAIALTAMRTCLLGGAGWGDVTGAFAMLAPMAVLSLALGNFAFSLALRRERRLATLGQY